MKKLISVFITMILIFMVKPAYAENNEIFINSSFDDGINPFSVTQNNGNVMVVDAKTEGIGEEGKVLKITSDSSNNFIVKKQFEQEITKKLILMEAKFRATSEAGVRRLFTLESSAPSRNRPYGLVTIREDTNISDKPLIVLSENNDNETYELSGDIRSGYLVDENNSAIKMEPNTWYKVKFMYYINEAETILNFELYDNAGNIIKREKKSVHSLDSAYPLPDIKAIGFGVKGWGSDETIYIDDVIVRSVKLASDTDGKYLDVSFEDGFNPFFNISNSGTDEGSIEVVDAITENVGTSGNVLKIESGKNNVFSAKAEFEAPVLSDDTFVFETRFLTKGDRITQRLFTLHSDGSRNKDTGLLCARRIGEPYYATAAFPSVIDNNLTDYLKEVNTDEPFIFIKDKWYKIRMFFKASSEKGGEVISSIQIFDENGFLVNSGSGFLTQNSDFPLPNIKYVGFGTKSWDTSQTFYLDDIKVYKSENDKDIIKSAREGIELDEYARILEGGSSYLNVLRGFTDIPSADGIKALSFKRPRIIADEEDFSNVLQKDDDFVRHLNNKLLKYGEELILQDALTLSGTDKLGYSRKVLDKSIVLSYLYRITKNEKYIAPLEEQLLVAAEEFLGWEYWNYLQSGEMLTAIAVGYDWCYEKLSSSAKKTLEACVLERLEGALSFYEPTYNYIAMQENNWNAVCNGGNLIAALAFLEASPDLCSKIANSAIDAAQLSFASVGTGGGFKEGPGYWAYNMQYATYIMSTLEQIFASDLGIGDIPGFSDTWQYIINASSSDFLCFNYSDCGVGQGQGVWGYYFAKRYNASKAASYARTVQPEGVDYGKWEGKYIDALAALWSETITDDYRNLPKNHVIEGEFPLAAFRESWSYGSLFAAMLGGKAFSSHGSLDAGSFVLDSDGIRWIMDFGSEDYSTSDYGDIKSGRWKYYTQRAEGHNTLIINPSSSGPDRNIYGEVNLIKKDENSAEFDLSALFPSDVESAIRRISMDPIDRKIIIEDNINPISEADIYWAVHTEQNVVLQNGGKEAYLTNGNKALRIKIEEPSSAVFNLLPAGSMWPDITTSKDLSNVKKLSINLSASSKINIKVSFCPEYENFEIIGIDGFGIAESYKNVPEKTDIILSKKIDEVGLSRIKVINHLGNEIPFSAVMGDNPYTARISFPSGLASGMYYAIDISEADAEDGTKAEGKTKVSFGIDADNGNIFSYTAENNSAVPEISEVGTSCVSTYDFLNSKNYVIRHLESENVETGSISGVVSDEFYGKSLELSAQIISTKRRSEKRVFALYDKDGKVITNGLFRIRATSTDEEKWNSSNILAIDGTYFYDKDNERYLMDTDVPHLFRATLDIVGNNVRIYLSVINLETFEKLEKEISYTWRNFPKKIEIAQRSQEDDVTYIDNFKAFSKDSKIEISYNDEYIVIDSRNETPQNADLYKAMFFEKRLLDVEKEGLCIFCGKTSILRDKNSTYFIWDETLKPIGEIKK